MAKSKIEWNEAQLDAITSKGQNILVSAAAGSGKTTLLVERVIRMISRKDDPVDIDRLLIVTFTKAAAAQMRDKINSAIREALKEEPDNANLIRQSVKIHTAQISTIDSLCAEIVRENFQDVDIDPGFIIADDAENTLLKNDILKEVLEKHYDEAGEDFVELSDYYMEKDDSKIEDIILKMYEFSRSHPEPEAWIEESISPYVEAGFENGGEFGAGKSNWEKVFRQIIINKIDEAIATSKEGLSVARLNYGPYKFEDLFEYAIEELKKINVKGIDETRTQIADVINGWPKTPRISCEKDGVDEDLKEAAKNANKKVKEILNTLLSDYLYDDADAIRETLSKCETVAKKLAGITIDFANELEKKKKEKKTADFSDIEHLALKVLIKYSPDGRIERDDAGNIIYTQTADILAKSYDEIIVDEYQDTNMLQEYIINALSKERFGQPDVFMVGDVKQSIYGFRMACPELFIRKYNEYQDENTPGKLVILGENFRSVKEVLNITNKIFEKIMTKEIGGIEYREGHELKSRKEEGPKELIPEIIMVNKGGEKARNAEAYEVSRRIEELVASGKYKYSDIALLSRQNDNPALERMMSERGIPFTKNSKKGFFSSLEIRLTLNLLAVIDNPYQDIPMAAVLHSPLLGLSSNELALIKTSAGDMDISLYEAMRGQDKYESFVNNLSKWQRCAEYMDICAFLDFVLEESGLEDIFAAMPGGKSRKANIDYLKEKAKSFADGPYSGLFNFIRYVKEINDAGVDYGQAGARGSGAEAVQIMTIHGSKGLEFPVVFLIGAGKEMNENDLRGSIILDRDLGLGIEFRDLEKRIKKKTVFMETIKQKKLIDTRAEEMRLLYVAMTRAKEKLIITGCDRFLESRRNNWAIMANDAKDDVLRFKTIKAGSYLQMIGLVLENDDKKDDYSLDFVDADDVIIERIEEVADNIERRKQIEGLISDDFDISGVQEEYSYVYPFKKATGIQAKISPSQLEGEGDDAKKIKDNEEEDKIFYDRGTGALRGNAYHKYLQLFDFSRPSEIEEQLVEMKESGRFPKEYEQYIEKERIEAFLKSNLGKRITRAFENKKLFREQQFLSGTLTDINNEQTFTGIEASSDIPDEEMLLVQGVIDAYFEEDGNIILLDYKTDRNVDEETLKERYIRQQETYADALKKMYGKEVLEKYLYSISLDKEIRL